MTAQSQGELLAALGQRNIDNDDPLVEDEEDDEDDADDDDEDDDGGGDGGGRTKQSRSEKESRKAMLKLGMKPISGVTRQ